MFDQILRTDVNYLVFEKQTILSPLPFKISRWYPAFPYCLGHWCTILGFKQTKVDGEWKGLTSSFTHRVAYML